MLCAAKWYGGSGTREDGRSSGRSVELAVPWNMALTQKQAGGKLAGTRGEEGIVENPQIFCDFSEEDILEPLDLSAGGCFTPSPSATSPLISTPTTDQTSRALTIHALLDSPHYFHHRPPTAHPAVPLLYPSIKDQTIYIHLLDSSLDLRSLLSLCVSSPTQSGTFEWTEGVLVRSMCRGRRVVLEVDRGGNEVLGMLKPLVRLLGPKKWTALEVPSRGRVVVTDGFAIFASRSVAPSRTGAFPPPLFSGARISRDSSSVTCDAVRALGFSASTGDVGCASRKGLPRVHRSHDAMDVGVDPTLPSMFPNTTLREKMYFWRWGNHRVAAQQLSLEPERSAWVLAGRAPEIDVEKDGSARRLALRVGGTRLAPPDAAARHERDGNGPARLADFYTPVKQLADTR
ncbi:hypothetical protein DFH09DRAFT_1308800 [Mycena vulgaris]|nr:hypothetical protein DFH09DRAFT_1308800 [Mycena vulgaris]